MPLRVRGAHSTSVPPSTVPRPRFYSRQVCSWRGHRTVRLTRFRPGFLCKNSSHLASIIAKRFWTNFEKVAPGSALHSGCPRLRGPRRVRRLRGLGLRHLFGFSSGISVQEYDTRAEGFSLGCSIMLHRDIIEHLLPFHRYHFIYHMEWRPASF